VRDRLDRASGYDAAAERHEARPSRLHALRQTPSSVCAISPLSKWHETSCATISLLNPDFQRVVSVALVAKEPPFFRSPARRELGGDTSISGPSH
jgi:hypothetical protein